MNSVVALVLVAGSGLALGGEDIGRVDFESAVIRDAGHLYMNVATGERLFVVGDQQVGAAGEAGSEIWIVGGGAGCPGDPGTMELFFALDVETSGTGFDGPALLDWGDIGFDSVVDCVQVHWITDHEDSDSNSDGFADGVEGFGATWTFFDGMNGRSPQLELIALPIIEFSFYSLPGELSDPGDSSVALYTADIDLGGSFGSSLVFEIGDTDSVLGGASIHNARMDLNDADGDGIPDIDPDEDGFADWGWSVDFTQPGTADVDSDPATGDENGFDGDLSAGAVAGVAFGLAQPGEAVFDSVSGEWDWVSTGATAGINEDLFGLIDENGMYEGPMNFGGFGCDPYVPRADFAIVLYRSGDVNPCPADLNEDGDLDFFDLSFFIANRVDMNGDTVFDAFDISVFLSAWAQGCDL